MVRSKRTDPEVCIGEEEICLGVPEGQGVVQFVSAPHVRQATGRQQASGDARHQAEVNVKLRDQVNCLCKNKYSIRNEHMHIFGAAFTRLNPARMVISIF